MRKNKYENLTAEEAARFAKEESRLYREGWNDFLQVIDPNGFSNRSPLTRYVPQVKRMLFHKGMMTLTELTRAHYGRKKPGFFARLFRATKEARDYLNERKAMDNLVKLLKTTGDVFSSLKVTEFLESDGEPFDFGKYTKDRDYFNAMEKKEIAEYEKQLHTTADLLEELHPEKQTDGCMTMAAILRNYDQRTKKAAEKVNPELNALMNTTYPAKSEKFTLLKGGVENITYTPVESDFFAWAPQSVKVVDNADAEQVQFTQNDRVEESAADLSATAQIGQTPAVKEEPEGKQFN